MTFAINVKKRILMKKFVQNAALDAPPEIKFRKGSNSNGDD